MAARVGEIGRQLGHIPHDRYPVLNEGSKTYSIAYRLRIVRVDETGRTTGGQFTPHLPLLIDNCAFLGMTKTETWHRLHDVQSATLWNVRADMLDWDRLEEIGERAEALKVVSPSLWLPQD